MDNSPLAQIMMQRATQAAGPQGPAAQGPPAPPGRDPNPMAQAQGMAGQAQGQQALPPSPAQGLWSKSQAPIQQGPKGPPPPQAQAPRPIGGPPPMMGVPAVPPNPPSRVPPAAQRFANAQQIQQAYANNWNPNPVLLRAALGK